MKAREATPTEPMTPIEANRQGRLGRAGEGGPDMVCARKLQLQRIGPSTQPPDKGQTVKLFWFLFFLARRNGDARPAIASEGHATGFIKAHFAKLVPTCQVAYPGPNSFLVAAASLPSNLPTYEQRLAGRYFSPSQSTLSTRLKSPEPERYNWACHLSGKTPEQSEPFAEVVSVLAQSSPLVATWRTVRYPYSHHCTTPS